jgi:TatD DNase family protein
MPVSLFDTHAHIDMAQFDPDRPQVIERAIQAGVTFMVNPAVDAESSETIVRLAENDPHIYAAVGFHPHEAGCATEQNMKRLRELAKSSKRVVAIGEAGLDFYRNRAPREVQIKVLQWQLDLAAELALPIIIHSREAEKDTIALLGNWIKSTKYPEGRARGVIHCFSGSVGVARQYLEMGFYIAFGGYITYPSSKIAEVLKSVPQDKLLTETDCPYLAPQGRRGDHNEPAYMLETATFMAGVLKISTEELGRMTTGNARRLFGLDAAL